LGDYNNLGHTCGALHFYTCWKRLRASGAQCVVLMVLLLGVREGAIHKRLIAPLSDQKNCHFIGTLGNFSLFRSDRVRSYFLEQETFRCYHINIAENSRFSGVTNRLN
jgi:hypothetical protein